jgi:mRNA interferase RelE/StbE
VITLGRGKEIMPEYIIQITDKAEKQLDKFFDHIAQLIITSIKNLSTNPPPGCKKLKGRDAYRIRQGDYRIIYEIFDKLLVMDVIAIGHRKDIYD